MSNAKPSISDTGCDTMQKSYVSGSFFMLMEATSGTAEAASTATAGLTELQDTVRVHDFG
jgi:hypothetical protein